MAAIYHHGRAQNVLEPPFWADNLGGTDSTSAIQAALDTGQDVFLPEGTYVVSSALTFTTNSQRVFGSGRDTTIIQSSSATSVLEIEGSRQQLENLKIEASAGHGIDVTNPLSKCSILDVKVQVDTTSKNAIRCTGASATLNDVWLNRLELVGGASHATPLILITANGSCDRVSVRDMHLDMQSGDTAEAIRIDNPLSAVYSGFVIEGVTFDAADGGGIHASGLENSSFRDLSFIGMGTIDDHLIRLYQSATQPSNQVTVDGMYREDGTLNAVQDVSVESPADNVALTNIGSASVTMEIDVGDQAVSLRECRSCTLSNLGADAEVLWDYNLKAVGNVSGITGIDLSGIPTPILRATMRLQGDLTITGFTDPERPCTIKLHIQQNATGYFWIAWPSSLIGQTPQINLPGNSITIVILEFDGTDYHYFGPAGL
jgi:hypothetical protein